MEYNENNPIRSVDGQAVAVPNVYQWELEDISASGAGRTEDIQMHKKRIGQVVRLTLQWDFVSTELASEILTAFNPEYVTVCYLDAMEGTYVTAEFYVGNRSAPMFKSKDNLWENISFNLIGRDGAM